MRQGEFGKTLQKKRFFLFLVVLFNYFSFFLEEGYDVYAQIQNPEPITHYAVLDLFGGMWNDQEPVYDPDIVLRILEHIMANKENIGKQKN